MDVSGSDTNYARLLERLWAEGRTFLVIEHDIQPTARAFDHALVCGCEWSASPYKGTGLTYDSAVVHGQSLGFTRFRASLMARYPNAMAQACAIKANAFRPAGDYLTLDGHIFYVLRVLGLWPHEHVRVPHHHVFEYGCACGREHAEAL